MEGFRAYSKTNCGIISCLTFSCYISLLFCSPFDGPAIARPTRKKGIASHASVLTLNACAVFCLAYLPACSRYVLGLWLSAVHAFVL